MTPHSPPTHRAASRLALVALHMARWAERMLATHHPPLTVAQFLALRALADGAVGPGELARRASVSEPAVSQLLRGLEQAGLVSRELSADDRRRHHLRLTPEGEQCLASAADLVAREIGGLLGDLRGPEADRLARLLEQIAGTVEGTAPPRRPPPPPRRHPPGPR
jgi:DNA-binding MarR family transcriptional regulator